MFRNGTGCVYNSDEEERLKNKKRKKSQPLFIIGKGTKKKYQYEGVNNEVSVMVETDSLCLELSLVFNVSLPNSLV